MVSSAKLCSKIVLIIRDKWPTMLPTVFVDCNRLEFIFFAEIPKQFNRLRRIHNSPENDLSVIAE